MISSGAVYASDVFSDISGHMYEQAITELSAFGIAEGDGGMFRPDEPVKRTEAVKLMNTAFNYENMTYTQRDTGFSDVPESHWASGYVAAGVDNGFISGYGDGTFGAEDGVTFEQTLKMLVCALHYDNIAELNGGWPHGYIMQAGALKITDNVSAKNTDVLTRGQFSQLIDNALDVPLCTISVQNGYPVYTAQNGTGTGFTSAATLYHNVYTLKGKFTNTFISSSSVGKGNVEFEITYSRRFGNQYIDVRTTGAQKEIFKISSDALAQEVFMRTATVRVKKLSDNEYRIIYIVL